MVLSQLCPGQGDPWGARWITLQDPDGPMGDPKRLGSGPWFRHSGAPVKVTHELVNIVIPKLDEPRVPVEEGPEGLARFAITLGFGVWGSLGGLLAQAEALISLVKTDDFHQREHSPKFGALRCYSNSLIAAGIGGTFFKKQNPFESKAFGGNRAARVEHSRAGESSPSGVGADGFVGTWRAFCTWLGRRQQGGGGAAKQVIPVPALAFRSQQRAGAA